MINNFSAHGQHRSQRALAVDSVVKMTLKVDYAFKLLGRSSISYERYFRPLLVTIRTTHKFAKFMEVVV